MTINSDRLIGSAQIQPVIEKLYGHGTWRGAYGYIQKHGIPLHRTDSGKPFIYIREIIEYELSRGRVVSVDDLTIT
jgi:hypothetical protein